MSETENGRLGLYGAEHSQCNHLMTLDFKGLTTTMTLTMMMCVFVSLSVRPSVCLSVYLCCCSSFCLSEMVNKDEYKQLTCSDSDSRVLLATRASMTSLKHVKKMASCSVMLEHAQTGNGNRKHRHFRFTSYCYMHRPTNER